MGLIFTYDRNITSGHTSAITAISFYSKKVLLTAGSDCKLILWN